LQVLSALWRVSKYLGTSDTNVVGPLMGATDFSGSGRVRTWKSEVAGRTHHRLDNNHLIIHFNYTRTFVEIYSYSLIHLLINFILKHSAETL